MCLHEPELARRLPRQPRLDLLEQVSRWLRGRVIVPEIDPRLVLLKIRRHERCHGLLDTPRTLWPLLRPVLQDTGPDFRKRHPCIARFIDHMLQCRAERKVVGSRREEARSMRRILNAIRKSQELRVTVED